MIRVVRKQPQVFGRIVLQVIIAMMHHFARLQGPTKLVMHHNAMNRRVPTRIGSSLSTLCNRADQVAIRTILRHAAQNISCAIRCFPTIPARMFFHLHILPLNRNLSAPGKLPNRFMVDVQKIADLPRRFPISDHLKNFRMPRFINPP